MRQTLTSALFALSFPALSAEVIAETTLTIATVNNSEMIRMQRLTDDFTRANPDISLEWVTLEENALREKVTTDITTNSGQFDVLTIGMYEVPIWAKNGWLLELTQVDDPDDLLPAIRNSLSIAHNLYAAPFYGESSMMIYRTDLLEKAGLTMPEAPTWKFIADAARKISDNTSETFGICLPGKTGSRENMAFLTAVAYSFNASWFDLSGQQQFNKPEWTNALGFLSDFLVSAGHPRAVLYNPDESNFELFNAGKCAMWFGTAGYASFTINPKYSQAVHNVGFALAPDNGFGRRGNWLWAWSLAIPAGSDSVDAAQKFISWATSKRYTELVASKEGWANVSPGTRTSLYMNPEYRELPFAKITHDSIESADGWLSTQLRILEFSSELKQKIGEIILEKTIFGRQSINEALSQMQETASNGKFGSAPDVSKLLHFLCPNCTGKGPICGPGPSCPLECGTKFCTKNGDNQCCRGDGMPQPSSLWE